jgi:hypothetical protein
MFGESEGGRLSVKQSFLQEKRSKEALKFPISVHFYQTWMYQPSFYNFERIFHNHKEYFDSSIYRGIAEIKCIANGDLLGENKLFTEEGECLWGIGDGGSDFK